MHLQHNQFPNMSPPPSLVHLLILMLLLPHRSVLTRAAPGKWDLLVQNAGVSAMHMQLLHTDHVVFFDRTDRGASNISLPNGRCRHDPNDQVLKIDCTAHSIEYDVASNTFRPLMILTDTWCSSGAVLPSGDLLQTGGEFDGKLVARVYTPCTNNSCDWREINPALSQRRWYATNHILPDGRVIIVGGNMQFSYEFYPKRSPAEKPVNLPFLAQTNDPVVENNLYPFVFLNFDGNLFIFANNRAILLDYVHGAVVKNYPIIPGGEPRNYPSTGSAVLLPLKAGAEDESEVLVCGGAPKGVVLKARKKGILVTALDTCGRIRINDPNPKWVMETMPMPRVFGDMVLLPNGNVLIINGAGRGIAGWDLGKDPVLSPVIYQPDNSIGSRFDVQSSSTTPRMYHSTAVLLRDGRVLVGGSNPHENYSFYGVQFPTDLSLQAFSPNYMDLPRPRIISRVPPTEIGYMQKLILDFTLPNSGKVEFDSVKVTMLAPPFSTHSFSQSQRLLVLGGAKVTAHGNSYRVRVLAPGSRNLAPPGYYILFVVHQDVPSEGIWIHLN